MLGVHPVDEVRSAEDSLMARVPEGDLMQRAAAGLARTCAQLLGEHAGRVYGSAVVLLVGTGNNGGDALFAGARLAARGARVCAVACGNRMHEGGTLALLAAGGHVVSFEDAYEEIAAADLVVDGMLGIGGKGGLRDTAATLAALATDSEAVVVAADLPSGVDADTGAADDDAVWADVTVTFGTMKPGLLVPPGSLHTGLLEVVDIGLHADLVVPSMTCLEARDLNVLLPHPVPLDHKYSAGVTGIVAGSDRYPGAAVLAVGGALHTKPGLVRYVGSAHDHVVRAWPSSIVTTGSIDEVGRVQAWGIGPGLGTDAAAADVVREVLSSDVPVVLDADALAVVADDPTVVTTRQHDTVLTPHAREFARLAPDLDLTVDPVLAVRTLASRWDATVLLKGSTTIVADPDGQVRLTLSGTPWLAVGGTGDVLTGVVAALAAAGLAALDAASVGAFVHGVAGRIASDGAPITASDVISHLPDALRELTRP